MLTAAVAQLELQATSPDIFSKIDSLAKSINSLTDGKSPTFIEASVWADDIKGSNFGATIWNDWHFMDVPYIYDATIPIINYTQTVSNSVYIVEQAKKVLSRNLERNSAERALLARYLVHLVGDIHQPLHSVALFNQTYPKGDQGGNLLRIKLPGNETLGNFHSYWDSGAYKLQDDTTKINRPLDSDSMNMLLERAQAFLDEFREEIGGLGKTTNPSEWAMESFRVAVNTTYPTLLHSNSATPEYVELSYWTARKRVVLGGLRLASIIQEIFTNKVDGVLVDRAVIYADLIKTVKGSQQL